VMAAFAANDAFQKVEAAGRHIRTKILLLTALVSLIIVNSAGALPPGWDSYTVDPQWRWGGNWVGWGPMPDSEEVSWGAWTQISFEDAPVLSFRVGSIKKYGICVAQWEIDKPLPAMLYKNFRFTSRTYGADFGYFGDVWIDGQRTGLFTAYKTRNLVHHGDFGVAYDQFTFEH
jgi:hypothetical protein